MRNENYLRANIYKWWRGSGLKMKKNKTSLQRTKSEFSFNATALFLNLFVLFDFAVVVFNQGRGDIEKRL